MKSPAQYFFQFTVFLVENGDDLPLGLEIEIHGPVVDPVGPVPGQHLAADHAFFVLL